MGRLLITHLLYTKTEEDNLWVRPTPLRVSCQLPISCTQFKIRSAQRDNPVSEKVSTLFSLFFGGSGLSIPDQDCGRDFMGEAESIAGQSLVTHLLNTVQDPISTAGQSSFPNSFHTLLCVFWWTKSDSIPDQDCGRDLMDEADSIASQPLVIHLLYTVQDPISKTRRSSF